MTSPKLHKLKNILNKGKTNIICSLVAIAIMVLAWIIAFYSVDNEYIIPSFADSMASLWDCIKSASFWTAFFNTLLRTVIAFVISFVLGVALAVISVFSKVFSALLKPLIIILRTLPTLAVILMLLIWTNPKIAPVIVTVLVLFPIIYSQVKAAIGDIDEGLVQMANVFEINRRDRLLKIYLPLISPNILSQTGANFSLGIKVMISAEVLANTYKSLGGLMQNARLYLEMPRLAALTIMAIVLGLLIELIFLQIERLTFKWSKKEGCSD